jgi:hypothetical protein
VDSFCESMDLFCFVITNPDSKKVRFVLWSRILDSYRIVDHKSSHFQKICFADSFRDTIFKRFDESDKSYESSQILSTIDLRIHTNPVLPDSRIPTVFKRFVSWIRFVLRCSKDSFRGFVSWRNVQKIRFVDSICKTKNLKRFDLFRFGRIRIQIPHP